MEQKNWIKLEQKIRKEIKGNRREFLKIEKNWKKKNRKNNKKKKKMKKIPENSGKLEKYGKKSAI